MIKIALCDDDLSVLKDTRLLIEQYCAKRNQKIVCAAFCNPLELLAEIEKGMRPDILFLDVLMPGENGICVAKEIRQDLTYRDLYDSIENMWGVLFATGYLTSRGQAGDGRLSLAIPNKEVQEILARQLIQYFQEAATKDGAAMEAFCTAVQEGDAAEVERRFQAYLRKTVSIHDYSVRNRLKENFYHGILLGFLSFKEGWTVASNRETGEGYSDIVIVIEEESTGVIIEVKYPQSGDIEAACQEALAQIGQMRYGEFLRDQGIQTIFKYGIACWKKRCKVVLEKELR